MKQKKSYYSKIYKIKTKLNINFQSNFPYYINYKKIPNSIIFFSLIILTKNLYIKLLIKFLYNPKQKMIKGKIQKPSLEDAIIELYLNVKVRKQDEVKLVLTQFR